MYLRHITEEEGLVIIAKMWIDSAFGLSPYSIPPLAAILFY